MNYFIIRIFDFLMALLGLILVFPILLLVTLLCYFDTGSPFFIQERIGKDKQSFKLIKYRTMALGTNSIATHLVGASSITKVGAFLRRTKLDELPQLWNVLIGQMSLVGPRPGLFNQEKLTQARDAMHVFDVRPGITGLAQISNVDMSTPELLAEVDARMIEEMSLNTYFHCIIMTLLGRGSGDRAQ